MIKNRTFWRAVELCAADTVVINGIKIDVPNEKYDYRHP